MEKKNLLTGLLLLIIFISCKKSDSFTLIPINDYAPFTIGKYITYQLDSLIFANNVMPNDRVISYQVKQLVADLLTDNGGRKGFLITRFIRKTSSDNWVTDNSFSYFNTGNKLEFTENNLTYIKLAAPISMGNTWKGNSYIDTYSASSTLQYLDDWNYTYDSIGAPLTLGNLALPATLKVKERNDTLGIPSNSNYYSEINFSVSYYGKGIGLVKHQFIHQEYQPPAAGRSSYKLGYGVTLTMIDYN